jgi:hypothetical protein
MRESLLRSGIQRKKVSAVEGEPPKQITRTESDLIGAAYGLASSLPGIAQDFVERRRLGSRDHGELWYIEDFLGFSRAVAAKRTGEEQPRPGYDPRIFIPFFGADGQMYAAQGRALLEGQAPKYLTVLVDESKPKLYNFENVDVLQRVYVFEGPIDSMFLPNSVAMAGASASAAARDFVKCLGDAVFVFDRDFAYNPHVRKAVKAAVDKGFRVFVHPPEWGRSKDVNDYVIETGASRDGLVSLIDGCSYTGVVASARLAAFKKKGTDVERGAVEARPRGGRHPLRSKKFEPVLPRKDGKILRRALRLRGE